MHYHYGPSTSADEVPSSPPTVVHASSSPAASMLLSPTRTSRRKEKRNPSVTPRRFGRFFTPRSSMSTRGRKILGMLDEADINHRLLSSPQSLSHFSDALGSDAIGPPSPSEGRSNIPQDGTKRRLLDRGESPSKKRRRATTEHDDNDDNGGDEVVADDHDQNDDDDMPPPPLNLAGLPPQSTSQGQLPTLLEGNADSASIIDSLGEQRKATLNLFFKVSRNGAQNRDSKTSPRSKSSVSASLKAASVLEGYEPNPIRRFRHRGGFSHLLDREHGFSSHAGSGYLAYPAFDPRVETSAFYSRSIDNYYCTSNSGSGTTIPFSMASCHKSSLTAIGDEQGHVRLFNTATSDSAESKVETVLPVHDNAIMDLSFSDDDGKLATAAGDRSGRIVDMVTGTVVVELARRHWDSLRQVSFQPGPANGNVLATSDRVSQIQIWDLRCSSPVTSLSAGNAAGTPEERTESPFSAGQTVNTIHCAHQRSLHGTNTPASVTAIQWMPAGREHLLLSASEANASIKLWDTRYIIPRRSAQDYPLAVTTEPMAHGWRSYGITSMALNSDASRLYALCRDSTVYAYSTSHLMLGHAPELRDGAPKRKPRSDVGLGLGPLYGFKHPSFRAQSFYVKCSMRPSINGSSEILAVGSTDGCPVLFPTDERYLKKALSRDTQPGAKPAVGSSFTSTSSSFSASASTSTSTSSLPISRAGTPLIRGHSREVTTLNWTHDGKLVTASDDHYIRQWQQDEAQARYLRQVGEFGGERHMAGWADVGDDWDVEC